VASERRGRIGRIGWVTRCKNREEKFTLVQKGVFLNKERLLFDASFTELYPFKLKY